MLLTAYVDRLKVPLPRDPRNTIQPALPLVPLYPTKSSDVLVFTEAVFKQNGAWSAKGGWADIHITPHIKNGTPQGGNMPVDFHVAWVPFSQMKKRISVTDPVGTVDFWW